MKDPNLLAATNYSIGLGAAAVLLLVGAVGRIATTEEGFKDREQEEKLDRLESLIRSRASDVGQMTAQTYGRLSRIRGEIDQLRERLDMDATEWVT